MKSKIFLSLIMYVISNSVFADVCAYYEGNQADTRSITLPATVSIPRDAPNGSVIYESAPITYSGSNSFKCSSTTVFAVKNLVGADVADYIQPIGETGIGWQWIYQGVARGGILVGQTVAPGGYGFNGTTTALRFVKIGVIKSDAKIPSGPLGSLVVGGLYPYTIQTNGVAIAVPSCETPDVSVPMGTYTLSDFSNNQGRTAPTSFSIKLNNCPAGISKVSYKFVAASLAPAVEPTLGIISLNSTSTAEGIGLQITDEQENPINLNLTYTFNEYLAQGGSFEIPFFARYLKVASTGNGDTLRAGKANTGITFVMSYL